MRSTNLLTSKRDMLNNACVWNEWYVYGGGPWVEVGEYEGVYSKYDEEGIPTHAKARAAQAELNI